MISSLRRLASAGLLLPVLAALAQAPSPNPSATAAAPRVESAWARPTVAGQSAGGGFLTIVGGTASDRLIGASAEISAKLQLHRMSMDGNVMKMREVPAIEVPAGQQVELKPGGLHIMFVGLKQPLSAGMHFPLTLHFEKAGDVKVEMQVMNQAMPMPMGHETPMK